MFTITDDQVCEAMGMFDKLPWADTEALAKGRRDKSTGAAAMAYCLGHVKGWTKQETLIVAAMCPEFKSFTDDLVRTIAAVEDVLNAIVNSRKPE